MKGELLCEVKRCRQVAQVTLIGVRLCQQHWLLHCSDRSLDTVKGLIRREGKVWLIEKTTGVN